MLHKTFFYKDSTGKRIPFKNKPSIKEKWSVDGSTTISPVESQQPADTDNISALDQSSAGKVTQKIDNHQEKEQKFSGEGENSSVVPGINRPEGEVLKLMGYDVQLYYNDVAPETSYMRSSSRFAQTGR